MWNVSYYSIVSNKKKSKERKAILKKKGIESIINALRKDFSLIERCKKRMLRKESRKTRLDHLYRFKMKEYKRAAEELK